MATRKNLKTLAVSGASAGNALRGESQAAPSVLSQAHREVAEGISRMARSIAHSLNNVLAISRGNLMLLRGCGQSSDSLEMIDDALTSLADAEHLSDNLAALANSEPFALASVDLAQIVSQVADGIRESLGPDVEVAVNIEENLPRALADARFLELAVKALAQNGLEAIAGGGRLEFACQLLPERVGAPRTLCIRVSDSGPGFGYRDLFHAFEPGFSSKKKHAGIGIGLWFVREVAQGCGGHAVITSAPGKPGAVVEVRLFPASSP